MSWSKFPFSHFRIKEWSTALQSQKHSEKIHPQTDITDNLGRTKNPILHPLRWQLFLVLLQTASPKLLLWEGYSASEKIHQNQYYWKSHGALIWHIHIQYSPKGDLFISLNTQTFSMFFCFLTLTFLTWVSQYASNPSVSELSVCGKCKVLIMMKRREAGLLGDDGKRQHPLTGALTSL